LYGDYRNTQNAGRFTVEPDPYHGEDYVLLTNGHAAATAYTSAVLFRQHIADGRFERIAHDLLSPAEKQAWYEHLEHLAMLYAQILRETDRESPRPVYLSADAHEGLERCKLLMANPIFT
jgi:hypothetical protein